MNKHSLECSSKDTIWLEYAKITPLDFNMITETLLVRLDWYEPINQ